MSETARASELDRIREKALSPQAMRAHALNLRAYHHHDLAALYELEADAQEAAVRFRVRVAAAA